MTFDVVVCGAGLSGGLPCAAYLQKAGLRVALVEARPRTGEFFRSYEFGGQRFDHSPVNFSCLSPALLDLDLESYGYSIELPRVLYSAISGDRTRTLYADPALTRAELGRDGDAFVSLLRGLRGRSRALLKEIAFTPEPNLERASALTAEAVGFDVAAMSGVELVESLFETDEARVVLTALPAINLFGDLLEPGQGALAWLWTYLLRACEARGGNGTLVDALERCFVQEGGTLLVGRVVRELRVSGGECVGVTLDDGTRVDGDAVVSNLGARLTGELLGEPLRPEWRSAARTVMTADLVLREPPRWQFADSPRVYLLWESWDACKRWLHGAREEDEETFYGHWELTQYGPRALRVRFGTGPYLDDGWDERRGHVTAQLRERLAPFGLQIEAMQLKTPLDHWRENSAAVHGNPVGGDFVPGQWLGERVAYRTGVSRLYASNSVWPPALSWLGAGYNAAIVVAEDLGLRRPEWWRHEPGSWLAR